MEQSEPQHQDDYLILEGVDLKSNPSIDPSAIYRKALSPAERIWAAVLVAAISDLNNPKEGPSALAWIKHTCSEIGSFNFCCELFALEPGKIREYLLGEYKPRYLNVQRGR